jgi:hypothetical protein
MDLQQKIESIRSEINAKNTILIQELNNNISTLQLKIVELQQVCE